MSKFQTLGYFVETLPSVYTPAKLSVSLGALFKIRLI